MRSPALALCVAAFATSLALVAPHASATTPESQIPRTEPTAKSDQVRLLRSEPTAKGDEVRFPRSEAKPSGEVDRAGRYCTPTGCAGDRSSPLAQAASFGAAAATLVFLARRRRA